MYALKLSLYLVCSLLLVAFITPATASATTGAYQRFEHGTIYSSNLGTFAVFDPLDQKYRGLGATSSQYGFPVGETYVTSDRGQCQQFEEGLLCERELVDTRSPAEIAIDNRATQLGSSGASELTNICNYPAKIYSALFPGEDGFILYVGGQAVYSYGGTLDTFNYYADKCTRFGVMTNDPQTGGVGPYNTPGAYQDFQNGRIYWSWRYLGKFVFGAIQTKFEQAGGTNSSYGWPTSEIYAVRENGVTTICQNFEGDRICEQNIPAYTEAQIALRNAIGIEVLVNEIATFCGGMQKVSITGGIAYYDPNFRNVRRVTGDIYAAWGENCNTYGLPENDTSDVTSVTGAAGQAQRFNLIQKVTDFYNSSFGLVVLEGSSRNLYESLGGLGATGFPKRVYTDQSRGICVETEVSSLCERSVSSPPDINDMLAKVTGIELVPNNIQASLFDFYIDNNTQMPVMTMTIKFKGNLTSAETQQLFSALSSSFSWNLNVAYWDGTWSGTHFITQGIHRRRSGAATGDAWSFSKSNTNGVVSFNSLGQEVPFGGGADGKVSVQAIINGVTYSDEKSLRIWGVEPGSSEKLDYMPKEIKAIVVFEARQGNQFSVSSAGGNKLDPVVSFDGGFGLTQLTECNGLPTYGQIWSWKQNIDGGQACFEGKKSAARNHLDAIIGAGNYTNDQLMREAFQRYNGTYYYDNIGGVLTKSVNCKDYLGNVCTYGDNVFNYYKTL